LLTTEGESFNTEDLQEALGNLVGKTEPRLALPKDLVTSEEFASDLLGFEEYEEGDDEDDMLENTGMGAGQETGMYSGMATGVPETIPEEANY